MWLADLITGGKRHTETSGRMKSQDGDREAMEQVN